MTNYPIEQVLAASIPDMGLHLSVEVTHLPILTSLTGRCSVVVAGVHTTGVGRHLPIRCFCTELKFIPSTGDCRCDKTAMIETLFFSLATVLAQTTLTLRYGVLLDTLRPGDTLILIL